MSEEIDPTAPYGRNPKTGEPYKRTPEERARLASNFGRSRARGAGRGGAPRAARKATPVNPYETTMLGLFQIPAFGLQVASRFNPVFQLDALAFTLHAPPLAKAVAQVAVDDARMAAVLDKVAEIGPWSAVVLAAIPLILQLGANHGRIKPNVDMGILDADQLMEACGVEAYTVDQDVRESASVPA